ncbi:MAG: hypothetical protein CJD30_11420 [Sulfuricurvum sp. PD_MW2]|jgi:hypothetical protein|uniref:hypothetical protein n=1 Tax=Sulfuricurvum sp. PD_MW2 TaxID=2027917 RepID=UPI000C05D2A4|nr:hypothetical protein [Sulfuricurvum sp. PD_MW2]PHM16468.1 MAG: hypothetical protein CJD30_11420 [Sulfuricurvum sp. PD_MW2]
MRKYFEIAILGILSAVLLTACAPMASEIPQGPQAYREGYADGCSSGYVAAGQPYMKYKKDVYRAGSDSLYKEGWTDGYNTCKGKYDNVVRSTSRRY